MLAFFALLVFSCTLCFDILTFCGLKLFRVGIYVTQTRTHRENSSLAGCALFVAIFEMGLSHYIHVNVNVVVLFSNLVFFLSHLRSIFNSMCATFQLDLQLQDEMGGDLSSFVTNGEWELLGTHTRSQVLPN